MSLVPDYIKNLSSYKAGKPISEVQRELGIENVIKLCDCKPHMPGVKKIQKLKNTSLII